MGYQNYLRIPNYYSIVGAIVGINGVPKKWYKNFNNECESYLIGTEYFEISDLLDRFTAKAKEVYFNK